MSAHVTQFTESASQCKDLAYCLVEPRPEKCIQMEQVLLMILQWRSSCDHRADGQDLKGLLVVCGSLVTQRYAWNLEL